MGFLSVAAGLQEAAALGAKVEGHGIVGAGLRSHLESLLPYSVDSVCHKIPPRFRGGGSGDGRDVKAIVY